MGLPISTWGDPSRSRSAPPPPPRASPSPTTATLCRPSSPVSTLAALAQGQQHRMPVVVAFDQDAGAVVLPQLLQAGGEHRGLKRPAHGRLVARVMSSTQAALVGLRIALRRVRADHVHPPRPRPSHMASPGRRGDGVRGRNAPRRRRLRRQFRDECSAAPGRLSRHRPRQSPHESSHPVASARSKPLSSKASTAARGARASTSEAGYSAYSESRCPSARCRAAHALVPRRAALLAAVPGQEDGPVVVLAGLGGLVDTLERCPGSPCPPWRAGPAGRPAPIVGLTASSSGARSQ